MTGGRETRNGFRERLAFFLVGGGGGRGGRRYKGRERGIDHKESYTYEKKEVA